MDCSSRLYQHKRCKSSYYAIKSNDNVETPCSSKVVSLFDSAGITSELNQSKVVLGQRSFKQAWAKPFEACGDDARPTSQMAAKRSERRPRPKSVGLIVRGHTYYVRWMIPRRLQANIGKTHFVRSLRTGRWHEAVHQARIVGAEFEQWLMKADGKVADPVSVSPAMPKLRAKAAGKTLEQVFALFINDPAKKRTPKTIARYHEMVSVLYDILGKDTPVDDIDREACRRLLDTLRWLPTNAPKRYPTMSAVAASEMARAKGLTDTLGPVSVNGYMIVASTIMTYAVNEGMIDRNHTIGLRVNDPIKKKDKRFPYRADQLRAIFNSPIYARKTLEDRKAAKWFVPLISLFTGMRLNEICSLEPQDIVEIDGVQCFSIKEADDKALKTDASERIIPIHRHLLQMGLIEVANIRKVDGSKKLFPELRRSKNGHYSVEFSKWYGRYTRKFLPQDDDSHKYVFHSFRHNCRDAFREAKIDHQIALALGGWASSSDKTEVHYNYGRGFSAMVLKEAVDLITYPKLDLAHLIIVQNAQIN